MEENTVVAFELGMNKTIIERPNDLVLRFEMPKGFAGRQGADVTGEAVVAVGYKHLAIRMKLRPARKSPAINHW